MKNTELYPDHDGICMYCGTIVPCEEADCNESAGHESICPECMKKERDRPDPEYLASEQRYDGSEF